MLLELINDPSKISNLNLKRASGTIIHILINNLGTLSF